MRACQNSIKGQSTSETVVLLPFFLLVIFGLLQLAQLATALMDATYAASSIARQAVKDGADGPKEAYTAKLASLMTVGMKNPAVGLEVDVDPNNSLLGNVKIHACAEISSFPFVSQFFGTILTNRLGEGSSSGCQGLTGSFAFNPALPAAFVVHGVATARMNYRR